MTSPTRKLSLEEVLDEFFFSADKPSPSMVLRACEAYPEYREDIIEFAALWSSYEASPDVAASHVHEVSDESVSRLQSFVLNRLHERDQGSASSSQAEAAHKAVKSLAGKSLRQAAAAAGLGTSALLLTKVLSKSIVDVPTKVLDDLAAHLNVALAGLQQCLGPSLAGAKSFRAKGIPNASAQETWEAAVRSLSVSDEEKQRLLALQTREGDS
ncbi:Uncharacterised protein [Burkholderia pseudomallei]|uniref:hypothetical protein n=1 Tax=Burkholderia pseudomallei TaxID=28450 RepID=UPI000F185494|nr:hypothetical protein [Burkholderia pseudomallei]VBY40115.1 Uncharacterised protein [Burkholderia pseudomallei]VBY63098.1 Uncharacterised protein [Burkholderia pseudomallei]VBY77317.1 Uncharacterised protein [Burkholderia pseudomallei]VBY88127.1 Uncharacterised protein [Burkholderia pseudomallei]